MWFGVLITCIILMGDVYIAKKWALIKKNVILALNNYLMTPYTFPELHNGDEKRINLN